ncbi:MAG: hypothetical protein D6704_00895 [Nitrospirae bacterium]|nr:MAG: hypothetical protein D6704_00895 [Nitrospirota bacterium]
MSQREWKPVRLKGDKDQARPSRRSHGSIGIELAVRTESARQVFEEAIRTQRGLYLKSPQDAEAPKLLILELDEDPAQTFSFIHTILRNKEDQREIFLTASHMDPSILLEALRAGVKEFFPQPIQPHEVIKALSKFLDRCQASTHEPARQKMGEILAVFGGKGGVGTTTIAANVALSLQQARQDQTVVLAEVNQHSGDLSLFFDLQTTTSFRDIGSDVSRLDTALLMRILAQHDSGLHVLPSGYDDLSSGRLTPECVEATLKLLHSLFDYIVVDCGHVLDITAKKVLETATTVFVVSTLIVPVVHRTKRVLDLLKGSGCEPDKIKVVINRYAPAEKEILRETEEALKFKTFQTIPNDYPTVSSAINNGTPVITAAPRTAIAKAFQEMAETVLAPATPRKTSSSWLGRVREIMTGHTALARAKAS